MSKRINEVRAKTAVVRDNIAKDLGFDKVMMKCKKAKDKKFITEAGFNPEDVEKNYRANARKTFS